MTANFLIFSSSILDDDSTMHGREIMGVKVHGDLAELDLSKYSLYINLIVICISPVMPK